MTLHIPGTEGTEGIVWFGDKLIILLQVGLGQAIRWDVALHISKQLQGHRTYFFPGGALRIGCKRFKILAKQKYIDKKTSISL